jgi:hypothetical protein
MASGLSAQVGYAVESTFGTGVTPSRFIEFTSESLDYNKQTVNGAGIAAGRVFMPGNARYIVGVGGGGDVTFNFPSKGGGFWLQQVMGAVASVTHAGTPNAYTHTFTPAASLVGQSFTLQKGAPEANNNTVDPYTFTGCKVNQLQLTMGQNALLVAKATIDAQNVTTATALATASYPSAPNYFSFANARNTLTVNGTPYAAIKSFDMTINNQLDVSRYYLGSGGMKAEPIRGDYAAATGTLTGDYVDTVLSAAFIADSEVALVTKFSAANIATTYYEELTITLSGLRLNGQLPQVGGAGIVPMSCGFDAFTPVAGGQAVSIVYQTSDATP